MNPKIYLLALGMFALGTDTFIVAGVLPQMAVELGVPVTHAAWVVTLFSLVYAVGAPIFATVLGSVPRKTLLVVSMFVFTLANIVSMQSWSLPLLLASRVVAAAAAASYSPAATACAASLAPPHLRGRAIAAVTGGLAVATVLGVPLGTLLGSSIHWRATFLFVIELGGVAMLLLGVLMPAVSSPPRVGLGTRLRVWARADVLTSLAITATAMTGVFAVYTFIGPLVAKATLLGAGGTAAVLLVYGVGTVVGNALGGIASDRIGATPTLAASITGLFIALTAFAGLATVTPSVLTTGLTFAAVFVWGAVGWGFNPAQSHRLLAAAGAQGPIALAANVSAIHLGVGLGSALGAAIAARAPLAALGFAGGAAQLVALLILAFSQMLRPVTLQGEQVHAFPR